MANEPTVDVMLKGLTKEELMVLFYVIPQIDGYGDPLKDIYELERDCKHRLKRPTNGKGGTIATLQKKICKPIFDAIQMLPSNGNKPEEE